MGLTLVTKASVFPLSRRIIYSVCIAVFLLVGLSLLEGDRSDFYQRLSLPNNILPVSPPHFGKQSASPPRIDGIILNTTTISSYTEAIFDTKSATLRRLQCPALNTTRYQSLRVAGGASTKIEYVFPLNLRQSLPLLPTLLGAMVEAIRFLGPKHCVLSIIEGNSPDGTSEVLEAIRPGLEDLGVTYFYQTTALDPSDGERIEKLSALRNAALQPVLDNPDTVSPSSTVVFLNDVLACSEDILELALQLRLQKADMTCAMDWEISQPPRFYDAWIARSVSGNSFWEIPEDMSWDKAWELFWNEPETARRFKDHVPFQVFACWNGGVTFRMQPLLEGLRFRAPNLTAGECVQGEPQLFCAELWFRGHGRIAVVPAVNFGYDKPDYEYIKKSMGFVSDWVGNQTSAPAQIDWVGPPDKVKCIEPWSKQSWQPWNVSLG